MLDGKISEFDLEKKGSLISLLGQRKHMYGSVTLKSVLAKQQGEWKNSFTLLQVLHRKEESISDETYRYPNCIVAKRSLSVDELIAMVEDLVTNAKLRINGVQEIPLEGYFSQIPWFDYMPTGEEPFKLSWPANTFVFEPKIKSGLPNEPFVTLDAPLFAGSWEVLRVWTGVDVSRYNQFVGSLLFILPNYSARIEELRLTSGSLAIEIREGETSIQKIIGKLYCEKLGSNVLQKDISFDQSATTIPLDFIPDWWHFYILSKDTGEILDLRKVHATWETLPRGVVVEVGSGDIEEILGRGENEHVEFKQDIKRSEEFVETIVAFANTAGGSIFVGVDDSSKVVGVFDQKFEERVYNQLRDTCEPMPEIKIEKVELQEKTIYVVNVAVGKDKPYNYKNRGFFVRSGSTDRLISRMEIDRFYQERQSQYPSIQRPY